MLTITFFGVQAKKVAVLSATASALFSTARPPHSRPLSRKGRGVKDLGKFAVTLSSGFARTASVRRPTFFASTQKKSPFFSAPKKPKKSVGGGVGSNTRASQGPRQWHPLRPLPSPLGICYAAGPSGVVLRRYLCAHSRPVHNRTFAVGVTFVSRRGCGPGSAAV